MWACDILFFLLFSYMNSSQPTECVTDLDYQSKMIIFESVLTTFESSVILWVSKGCSENWGRIFSRAGYELAPS